MSTRREGSTYLSVRVQGGATKKMLARQIVTTWIDILNQFG